MNPEADKNQMTEIKETAGPKACAKKRRNGVWKLWAAVVEEVFRIWTTALKPLAGRPRSNNTEGDRHEDRD